MADQNVQAEDKELIGGEAPPEPVELEIEIEEGAEEAPAAAAPGEPAKAAAPKPQSRRDIRVANALQAAQAAEERARQAEARAAAAEAAAEAAKRGETAANTVGMQNYAARIKAEADSAQREYEEALASGDAKAIAAANRKVAKVAAAEADVEIWQAGQTQAEERAPAAEPARPAAPAAAPAQAERPPSPATLQFFQENPWFTAVQLDASGRPFVGQNGQMVANPDFDEDMHDAAMLVHKQIERKVRLGKLAADYIESPEYFEEIRAEMQSRFPDAFEGEEAAPAPTRRAPPMTPARSAVAPATRGPAAPGAAPRTAKVTLDGNTASFVRSLVDNGTLRYKLTHPEPSKRGQPMAYEDAYKEYARQQKLIPQHSVN